MPKIRSGDPTDEDFHDGHPIGHFLRFLNCQPIGSKSRRTYGEKLAVFLTNLKDTSDIASLLERLFTILQHRITMNSAKPPKYIAVSLHNEFMDTPFYVPFRKPSQNSPETIAQALLQLNAQSGKRLKLFKRPLNIKVFGIFGFKNTKKEAKKEVVVVKRGKLKRQISTWQNEGKKKEKRKKPKNLRKYYGGCLDAPAGNFPIVTARSLVKIGNRDGMCLARSIVTCLSHTINGNNTKFQQMKNNTFNCQTRAAVRLLQFAKLPGGRESYSIKDAAKIQKTLQKLYPRQYRIVIFDGQQHNRIIYKGEPAKHNLPIILFKHHFQPILHPKDLFKNRGEYCVDCERVVRPYYHPKECKKACRLCYRFGLDFPCKNDGGPSKKCPECGFIFPNRNCFAQHLKKGVRGGKPICKERFFCGNCTCVIYSRSGKVHACMGEKEEEATKFCEKCQIVYDAERRHLCYIQPRWLKKGGGEKAAGNQNDTQSRFIFMDIETTQNKTTEINGIPYYKHNANLIIAEVICFACLDYGVDAGKDYAMRAPDCQCGVFGDRFRFKKNLVNAQNRRLLKFDIFDADDGDDGTNLALDSFLDFLINHGSKGISTYVIGHNAGRFDYHILLERIYALQLQPKMIMNGLKIYNARLSGSNQREVIFKDSLNFITGSLSSMYNTFELEKDGMQQKPFFPHFWNISTNLDIELPHLPPAKYYGPEEMGAAELAEFKQWYAANKNTPFNLKTKLIEYCINDVRLLRAGCVKFRQFVQNIEPGIEPFKVASTNAKLSLEIWLEKYLQPNMLINFPEEGLNRRQQQSSDALRFFKLYSRLTGKKLRTAEWSIGEKRAGDDVGYRLDAFTTQGGRKIAIEYYGCRFHGCKLCYGKNRGMEIFPGRTIEDLYEATQQRKFKLKRKGYRVIEVWECEWKKELKANAKLRKLWNETFVPAAFNPRAHALRGGRVEAFKLFAEAKEGECIEHYDIISLYPAVQKWELFPVGEPEVLAAEHLGELAKSLPWTYEKVQKMPYLGWFYVRIEAPKKMELKGLPPFLPYRSTLDTLLFPLCARCAELKSQRPCRHGPQKRSWTAAFLHSDLEIALKLGYTIHEIFEIWHWPQEQWTDELFAGYINDALKLKVESSGWPANCKTEEQKKAFIDEYFEREGIRLDPKKMVLNKGRRHLAKTLLNCLWGKLCERAQQTTVAITKTSEEFHALFENEELEVLDVTHLNEGIDRVVYRLRKEFMMPPDTNCVPIAAMVTAYGRQRLYAKFIEAVQNGAEVLYGDTDSIIIKRKQSRPAIKERQFLGDMCKELEGRIILKIVAAGPKNYIYIHCLPDGSDVRATIHIRSFKMTADARKKLQFDKVLKLVRRKYSSSSHSTRRSSYRVHYKQISRDKHGFVYNRHIEKIYGIVDQKGVVMKDLSVQPFGYSRN